MRKRLDAIHSVASNEIDNTKRRALDLYAEYSAHPDSSPEVQPSIIELDGKTILGWKICEEIESGIYKFHVNYSFDGAMSFTIPMNDPQSIHFEKYADYIARQHKIAESCHAAIKNVEKLQ